VQAVWSTAAQTQTLVHGCSFRRAWGRSVGTVRFRKIIACCDSRNFGALQSLARMGAHVTGIDVAAASVAIAERHAQDDPWIASRVTYREASAEQLVDEGVIQGLGLRVYESSAYLSAALPHENRCSVA
jgi:Methyltransferase domain